jgi:hypothetical protein
VRSDDFQRIRKTPAASAKPPVCALKARTIRLPRALPAPARMLCGEIPRPVATVKIVVATARQYVRFKAISAANPVAAVRAQNFLARHGDSGIEDLREGESDIGRCGWWEIGAADGYRLRCDWIRTDMKNS